MKTLLFGLSLQISAAVICFVQPTTSDGITEETQKVESKQQLQLPVSTQITRTPDLSPLEPTNAKYRVVCEICSDFLLSFSTPAVMVRDGERVELSDQSEQAYAVAKVENDDYSLPIARKISEGSKFAFTVLAIDEQHVLVDVAASLQFVDSNNNRESPQSIKVTTYEGRFLKTIGIGEQASASFGKFDDWTLKITVEKAEANPGTSEIELSGHRN